MHNRLAGSHSVTSDRVSADDSRGEPTIHFPQSVDLTSFLATIVNSSDDAIIGKSVDGVIFSWNSGAERLYGYRRDEVVGQSIALIVPPERRPELERIAATLRAGGRITHVETVRVRKDRTRVDVALTISPIIDADGTVLGASSIARDITGRKRAEEGERVALSRLRAVVDTAVDGIITIDHRGNIETVNPATVQMFGYTAEELIGHNVRMLMPEPYRSEHGSYMANYLRTGERKIIGAGREVQGRRKDGTVFPLELAVSETPLENRVIFTGIVRDVTVRHRAEQAIRESEARFRMMANSVPALIWMSNVDKAIVWLNNRRLEFTGRPLAQSTGNGWVDDVHPEDQTRCVQTYRAAFDAREPFEMEYRMRRFDGVYRWIHDTGVPLRMPDGTLVGYVGLCVDVTDHKLGEDALLERVAQRTSALSATNAQLHVQIAERRRIESLLATEKQILELIATGADLAELLETLCSAIERLIPGSRCAIRVARGRGSASGRPPERAAEPLTVRLDVFGTIAEEGIHPPLIPERLTVAHTHPADTADGHVRRHDVRSYWLEPITAPGGTTVGTLGVYCTNPGPPDHDAISATTMAARLAGIIVERARGEERAREQLAQLAHVARLATMGEMASGLAHELNQPLCAITNFTEACLELMNQDGHDSTQLSQTLREIGKQAQRAGGVIRRLRDFVKGRAPQRESVDINKILREVVALTSVEARQSEVRVRMSLAKRLPKVFADSIQIEQVLVNLVRNAFEAMHDATVSRKLLTIGTLRRKGCVEVTVSDNGPGIPAETKERLFEPFFTTKSHGMGMGLSISRSILEVHEGNMWVTSNRNGGTTFHFTLPTTWRAYHGRSHRIRRR